MMQGSARRSVGSLAAKTAFLFALAPLLGASFAQTGVQKLNAELHRPVRGHVSEARFTPDGRWVVYRGDQDVEDVVELYLVPSNGGRPPRKLNGPPQPDVRHFEISGPAGLVVFFDGRDLWSAPIEEARAPLHLGAVSSFISNDNRDITLAPGGRHVAFPSDEDGDGQRSLSYTSIEVASEPVLLSGSVAVLTSPRFTPDGARLVFQGAPEPGAVGLYSAAVADGVEPTELFLEADGVRGFALGQGGSLAVLHTEREVWAVPTAGGTPRLLSGVHATGRVRAFAIDPTATWVLYQANFDLPSADELYLVPVDGSLAPRKIHPPLAFGRDTGDFRFAPDGLTVFYTAQQSNTQFELYDVPTHGSTPPRRIVPATFNVAGFAVTPDGTRIVYTGYVPGDFGRDLFSVSRSDLDDRVLLTDPVGDIFSFEFTPDGERLFLRGAVGGISGAFFTSVEESDVIALSESTSSQLSPDGTRLLFFSQENGTQELYGKAADEDRRVVKLNAPLPLGPVTGDVTALELGGQERNVVFNVHIPTDFDGSSGSDELHAVPLDGSAAPFLVYRGDVNVNDVRGISITADDTRLLYRAGSEEGESYELYSAPLDQPGESWQVNKHENTDYGVGGIALVPDGSRVVYTQDNDDHGDLYSARTDVSIAQTDLAEDVWAFRVAPDGQRVLFTRGGSLFSVRVDGSASPVMLHDPVAPDLGYYVREAVFSADGSRAAYVLDDAVAEVHQLHAVRTDGSAAPISLSGALVAGGDVAAVVEAAGERVVYAADQSTDEVVELWSVPFDGSATPVKLSGSMTAGGDVQAKTFNTNGFRTSRDTHRVVYLADQERDGVVELHAVASDGSSANVRLHAALPAFADVLAFEIASDSTRVVFVADALVDERHELFTAPIDGSAPAVPLVLRWAEGGDVAPADRWQAHLFQFAISADGARVAFVADSVVDERFELFWVPIDGSRPPVRVNAPMVFGGDVTAFRLTSDSLHALYLADQDTDEVGELYRAPLRDGPTFPPVFRLR